MHAPPFALQLFMQPKVQMIRSYGGSFLLCTHVFFGVAVTTGPGLHALTAALRSEAGANRLPEVRHQTLPISKELSYDRMLF